MPNEGRRSECASRAPAQATGTQAEADQTRPATKTQAELTPCRSFCRHDIPRFVLVIPRVPNPDCNALPSLARSGPSSGNGSLLSRRSGPSVATARMRTDRLCRYRSVRPAHGSARLGMRIVRNAHGIRFPHRSACPIRARIRGKRSARGRASDRDLVRPGHGRDLGNIEPNMASGIIRGNAALGRNVHSRDRSHRDRLRSRLERCCVDGSRGLHVRVPRVSRP